MIPVRTSEKHTCCLPLSKLVLPRALSPRCSCTTRQREPGCLPSCQPLTQPCKLQPRQQHQCHRQQQLHGHHQCHHRHHGHNQQHCQLREKRTPPSTHHLTDWSNGKPRCSSACCSAAAQAGMQEGSSALRTRIQKQRMQRRDLHFLAAVTNSKSSCSSGSRHTSPSVAARSTGARSCTRWQTWCMLSSCSWASRPRVPGCCSFTARLRRAWNTPVGLSWCRWVMNFLRF